jgi:hypothetical protein
MFRMLLLCNGETAILPRRPPIQQRLKTRNRNSHNSSGHFEHTQNVCTQRSVVILAIRTRDTMAKLTNKVLLPSAHHQRDEADHANQRGRETEHESKVDGGLVVLALDVGEEEEG